MRLRVRIEHGGAAGLPEVQALWERCTAAINPPPIQDIEQVLYGVSYGATNGFARAVPEQPPRRQDVIISQALFTLPPERQELTILHELLHLSIAHGALAQRWDRERELREQYPHPHAGLAHGADPDRIHQAENRHFLAFYYFLTPDEILAERALRDGYHDRLPERLRQHIAMRTEKLNTRAQDRVHPQMRKYWLALELQRAAMMIDIADDSPERTKLETIRETYRALLVEETGDAEAQRLVALVERINRYQVGGPDSEAACDEAFAELIALPYPEPAVAN